MGNLLKSTSVNVVLCQSRQMPMGYIRRRADYFCFGVCASVEAACALLGRGSQIDVRSAFGGVMARSADVSVPWLVINVPRCRGWSAARLIPAFIRNDFPHGAPEVAPVACCIRRFWHVEPSTNIRAVVVSRCSAVRRSDAGNSRDCADKVKAIPAMASTT